MAKATVAGLLRDGRIEQINPDVPTAWSRVDEAKTHLVSSAALAATDPTLAYVALYGGFGETKPQVKAYVE